MAAPVKGVRKSRLCEKEEKRSPLTKPKNVLLQMEHAPLPGFFYSPSSPLCSSFVVIVRPLSLAVRSTSLSSLSLSVPFPHLLSFSLPPSFPFLLLTIYHSSLSPESKAHHKKGAAKEDNEGRKAADFLAANGLHCRKVGKLNGAVVVHQGYTASYPQPHLHLHLISARK